MGVGSCKVGKRLQPGLGTGNLAGAFLHPSIFFPLSVFSLYDDAGDKSAQRERVVVCYRSLRKIVKRTIARRMNASLTPPT